MKYWVTTQWPHSIEDDAKEPHCNVYIPDKRKSSGLSMSPGDIVFIYESKVGRIEKRKMLDGSIQNVPCHPGREGIVSIVRVTSKVYEKDKSTPTNYADGTTIWWRYMAETKHITSHGFISRKELNIILGYKSSYSLRGFGDMHSGVKEISELQGNKLIELFSKEIKKEVEKLLIPETTNIQRDHQYGGTGEGALHKSIKLSIQNNPELLLGERGLKHIKTEHLFKTSDRVDLLLLDRFNRFVVVEVEPECINGNDVGSAQCMKYRSLMAYESNRKEYEIRAMLAAPKIDQDIIRKAELYNIEIKIIDTNHLTTA